MAKSIYPSIPSAGNDMPSMRASLDAMRQTLTMLIMNAQNPSPTFAASSAAQVFVTQDQLKATGVVGPTGPSGPQGPPGPGIAEAPNDTNTYGRHALAWVTVLTPAGGTLATLTVTGATTLAGMTFSSVPVNAVDDVAAAAAGIVVGGVYRNGSQLMVRVT